MGPPPLPAAPPPAQSPLNFGSEQLSQLQAVMDPEGNGAPRPLSPASLRRHLPPLPLSPPNLSQSLIAPPPPETSLLWCLEGLNLPGSLQPLWTPSSSLPAGGLLSRCFLALLGLKELWRRKGFGPRKGGVASGAGSWGLSDRRWEAGEGRALDSAPGCSGEAWSPARPIPAPRWGRGRSAGTLCGGRGDAPKS